jgi:hypothetical protein
MENRIPITNRASRILVIVDEFVREKVVIGAIEKVKIASSPYDDMTA